MMDCRVLIILTVFVVHQIGNIDADTSDEECGIFEDEVTTKSSSTENVGFSENSKNVEFVPKKPKKKKSLLIVFDGRISMVDDLIQMRDAAKKIIANLAQREDKPIKNYVFVVFKDPVQMILPTVNTRDHKELFTALDQTVLQEGSEGPGLCLTGLKLALEHSEQNSLAYVFSDAAAKDHELYSTILPIIQKKQVRVSFLITPGNGNKTDVGYAVYDKIAAASEGQVFDIRSNQINDILLSISQALDPSFETVNSKKVIVGGISELKFGLGFSTASITDQSETAIQPLKGFKNILSIFVSDHDLVKCLIKAILIPANDEDPFEPIVIPLNRVKRNIYSSDLFDMPLKLFKIKIFGYNKSGTIIDRLISSSIESVGGVPPEVDLEPNSFTINEYSSLTLTCKVMSLTPITTTLMFESNFLKSKSSNQSVELVMIVDNFKSEDVGKYSCKSENALGQDSKEISVGIVIAPIVKVTPEKLNLKSGERGSLACEVGNPKGDFKINWIDKFATTEDLHKNTYEFTATKQHHNQKISCQVIDGDFVLTNGSLITVEFKPTFVHAVNPYKPIKRRFFVGDNLTINCDTIANPPASTIWFHSKSGVKNFQPFTNEQADVNLLKLYNMPVSMATEAFRCISSNSMGSVSKTIIFDHYPHVKPSIETVKKVFSMEGDKVELKCSCTGCLPIKSFPWTRKSKKKISHKSKKFEDFKNDEFTTTLVIPKFSRSDEDVYICELKNVLGSSIGTTELVMNQKPRDLKIVLKIDKKVSEIDKTASLTELKDYSLECSGVAHPIAEIFWEKNGHKIGNKNIFLTQNKMHENAGKYRCTMENLFGSISKEIEIFVKPEVLNELDEKLLEVDQLVTLDCNVTGNLQTNISWFYEIIKLENSEKYKISSDGKKLQFQASSDGQGKYSCETKNEFGENFSTYFVIFYGPPQIKSPGDELIKKMVGDYLELSCSVTGFPKSKIYWTKDGKKLNEESILKVDSVSSQDAGVFICHAENRFGKTKKQFEISFNVSTKNCNELEEKIHEGELSEVDGGWSDYEVSPCSRTCGMGYQVRTRKCNNPEPTGRGRNCVGLAESHQMCRIATC